MALKNVIQLLLILAAMYLAACLLVFLAQPKLVYQPGGAPSATPEAHGLEFEEARLTTSDGVELHSWFLPAADSEGAIVFCHGNGGNIENRIVAARVFTRMKLSVLLFDYRGYGASGGSPDEEGTYRDAEAAYDFLANQGVFADRISVYGESLGCAVALELTRRRAVRRLMLESPFTSLPDMGARLFPWLPVSLLARYRYDNESKIGALEPPLLIAHSPDDETVPFDHGELLFAAAREPKRFLKTVGGHNDGGFQQRAEWVAEVESFFTQ